MAKSIKRQSKIKYQMTIHGDWDGMGGHEGITPKEKRAKITKFQMPIEAIYSA